MKAWEVFLMARSTVSDAELLDRSTEVFRAHGFEGTSLSRLSEATGLEKASLYHRFPGGKEEIALAVARGVSTWFQEHVFEPLKRAEAPQKKIRVITEQLRVFYADGTMPCALDALSLSGGGDELASALKGALLAWLKAFTDVGRESGLSAAEARRRAEQAVIQIEGSLILGRVLGDTKAFRRALDDLSSLLTGE
jgi:TetR/AcrR family transcriptional repressor of lmrAB and yxaGH operons